MLPRLHKIQTFDLTYGASRPARALRFSEAQSIDDPGTLRCFPHPAEIGSSVPIFCCAIAGLCFIAAESGGNTLCDLRHRGMVTDLVSTRKFLSVRQRARL